MRSQISDVNLTARILQISWIAFIMFDSLSSSEHKSSLSLRSSGPVPHMKRLWRQDIGR